MGEHHTQDRIAASFRQWAEHAHGSPLYAFLAREVAGMPEVLGVAKQIEHRPRQNILFAAVHLLLRPSDPLAGYYPSVVGEARPPDAEAATLFRQFVIGHAGRIVAIGRTRYTQTNEPRRVTVLLPWLVQQAAALGEPVNLVEVGASAGLNLCIDGYTHRYRSGHVLGRGRPVLEVDDRGPVPYPSRFPRFGGRWGLDLHPLDLSNPDDLAWARALIWPEHAERRRRLLEAAAVRRVTQVRMVPGDAAATLHGVLDELPPGGPALVWHSFTWNQMGSDQRTQFEQTLGDAARHRGVRRIGLEYWDPGQEWPEIRIGLHAGDLATVARAHPHGEWLEAV